MIANDQVNDALAFAHMQVETGAGVIIGRSRVRDGDAARDAVAATGLSLRI